MILARTFLCFTLLLVVCAKKHHRHHSTEEDEGDAEGEPVSEVEKQGKEIVNRMMVNMAGAMVKSIFPEMDKLDKKSDISSAAAGLGASMSGDPMRESMMSAPNSEIRRAPSQFDYGNTPSFPGSEALAGGTPSMGNANLGAMLGSMAQSGALGTLTGQPSAGSMDPRMVNEMRNQAYLSELAKHQHELTSYSAKQMEYLDQQRRYQQALIDHQAEAALLMQKEQQKQISEQLGQAKEMYAKKRALATARAMGSRIYVPEQRTSKPGDRSLTSDADLRSYFKQQYGIDIPEDGASLTDDERATLRMLKVELATKKSKGRNGAIDTLSEFNSQRPRAASSAKSRKASGDGACGQCMPISIRKLKGAWTQLYGNPDVIKKTFGTIATLQKMQGSGSSRGSMSKSRPACVGMEIGKYAHGEAELNFFFREESSGNQLHEMKGELVKTGEKAMSLETDMYSADFCIVRTGPGDEDQPEYIVLAETKGANACRSLHVFARNTDDFNRRYFDDISDFMKQQVSNNDVLPVGSFSKAELCQLSHA